ncbi:MAG: hypothetical protein GXP08_14390 [Gammaproteobacteria bacterium]|nr:hypothetical protein [Gammaproteobacteria bacterium]
MTGISSINQGMDNIKQHAHEIASAVKKGDENTAELAKSLVDLNVDQRQVEASVKVVQAIDETLGTLLNVRA